jgi:hypothetical protein
MPERVPSDHESIETHRVSVSSAGGTDRPSVELPDAVDPDGDVVRLVLDGTEYHARVDEHFAGPPAIRGAYDNARLAREPREGTNRLTEWVEQSSISLGSSVQLDVVTPGYKYGLREPGTRVVYTASEPPSSSLSQIARDLDDS